jgi:hypothetical protein
MPTKIAQPLPPFRAEGWHLVCSSGETVGLVLVGEKADDEEFAARIAASLNLVAEWATMTNMECEFVDGVALRDAARATLQGRHLAATATYTPEEEERAVQAIRARYDPENSFASRRVTPVRPRELVHLVADALGVRRVGS